MRKALARIFPFLFIGDAFSENRSMEITRNHEPKATPRQFKKSGRRRSKRTKIRNPKYAKCPTIDLKYRHVV